MRVLIIEDNAIQALTLEMILTRYGFSEVKKAYSAKHAYQILNHFQPDLMLVDINLGGSETGIDIVKNVQKQFSVLILYITGNSDNHHKKLVDETDYFGYMVKPIDHIKLEKILLENEILAS